MWAAPSAPASLPTSRAWLECCLEFSFLLFWAAPYVAPGPASSLQRQVLPTLSIWGQAVAGRLGPRHSEEGWSPRLAAAGPTREALTTKICQECVVHFLLMMVVSFCLSVVDVFQIGPGVYIVDGRGSNGEDFGLLLTRIALSLAFITQFVVELGRDFCHSFKVF